MVERKWFGRDPALWIQGVAAVLAVLAAFGLGSINDVVIALVTAFLNAAAAAYVAVSVRPVQPAIFTGVVTTGAPLLALFGLHASQQQVGVLSFAVTMLVGLLVRAQVTPEHDPEDNAVVVRG